MSSSHNKNGWFYEQTREKSSIELKLKPLIEIRR